MSSRVIQNQGVAIATEAFGNPGDTPILLVMGMMASMLWWPDEFCKQLAARGRYVIRYDHRDTGESSKFPPGKPGYTFTDMVDDAVRVLDGYNIDAAHIAGMSMGGMIVQLLALKHASRVLTVTAISTSPMGIDTSHLPGSTAEYNQHAAEGEGVDWSDRARAIDYMVKEVRALSGKGRSFDQADVRRFVERDFERSGGYLHATNHFVLPGGEDEKDLSAAQLKPPLLVIHGTADPLFPVEHGAALSQAVPGATLLRIEGGGHELHPDDCSTIIEAITKHTAHC